MTNGLHYTMLTYGFCAALVALYAATRFNTPRTNRSSTVQSWYWQGLIFYVASSLALFGLLSMILEQKALRDLLLRWPEAGVGLSGATMPTSAQADRIMAIPAPLAATVIMTALLPSVPYVKRLDDILLAFFLRLACIPVEVTRRSRILHIENLTLTSTDLAEAEALIRETTIPNDAIAFLRASAGPEWQESELRFTKVLLLFRRLDALREQRRYDAFFTEYEQDYRLLQKDALDFATNAVKGLTAARKLRELETRDEYEELIADKRETFKKDCLEKFEALALFLARAVLQSERSEGEVRSRLRGVGFDTVAVIRPVIPVHQLATLSIAILVYLLVCAAFLPRPTESAAAAEFRWVPFLIAVSHVATIGFTLWFMQRFAFARRTGSGPRPVASYLLCGALAAGITVVLCAFFDLARTGRAPDAARLAFLAPFVLICGLLCVVTAFLCEDIPPAAPDPLRFRGLEAAGCALAMAFAGWLLAGLFPPPAAMLNPPPVWLRALLPGGTGLVVGFLIPAMYRAQLRLAKAPDLAYRDAGPVHPPQAGVAANSSDGSAPSLA